MTTCLARIALFWSIQDTIVCGGWKHMGKREPTTRTMKISEVKNQLSSLVNAVYRKETRVLVEKSGIPAAALVSAEDLARLEQLDKEWAEGTRALERFSEAFGDIPAAKAEADVACIIAAHRQQSRAKAERRPA